MIYLLGAALFVIVHALIYIACKLIDPNEEMDR